LELVGASDVVVCARAAQYDHGDAPQRRLALELGQHVEPALSRQLEIEQHHVRTRGVAIALFATQERERFHAVVDRVNLTRGRSMSQRTLDQPDIALVVFGEQDLQRLIAFGNRKHSPRAAAPRNHDARVAAVIGNPAFRICRYARAYTRSWPAHA
jgi:hypothetical protein